ncbi:helix-turn-helix domain-containing protein [Lyngbya aestuarii]|uniref:helix-turn-helix domain-containing protein n=1 Tax=Lyngbya aestuarii TaxID=118322 RepID=UPI00403E2D1F
MNNPRPLEQREQELINRLCQVQLGISPRLFRSKWDVNYEQLAAICHCTIGTVTRWFARGDNYRRPGTYPCLKLKLADLLLEHYQEIPENWFNIIFPPENQ